MQEFTSISVSSYEADTLAALLNEKSGDGWDVVAIVPTGSTVTAYLSKEKAEESAESKATEGDDAKPAATVATAAAADTAKDGDGDEDKPVVDPVSVGATAAVLGAAAKEGDAAEAPAKSPVDEPAGWAAGTGAAAGAAAATTAPAATTPSAAAAPAAAAATPAATPAAATPAAATPSAAAAPAGWYADPSSRYELRYWDGSQWTEHVSRAGQQFTDPPVA